MEKRISQKKGFTIIESLVAITILVVSVIGAMSAVQSGLSSYIFSKDQIVAFYLAQEGFEQIKNIRDENHMTGNGWLYGIAESSSDPCYFGQACTVSPVETQLAIRCSSPGNCPLIKQNLTTGFYGYDSSWTDTIYRREITLQSISSHEMAATVTVSWNKGLVTRQFKAKENILDWQ